VASHRAGAGPLRSTHSTAVLLAYTAKPARDQSVMPTQQPPFLLDDFTRLLPGDPEPRNYRRQVRGACWSYAEPLQFPRARLLTHTAMLAEQLGLSPASLGEQRFTRVFSGSELLPGSVPHAQCYGGHQFGAWAGQLGDGRAINLGAVLDKEGQPHMLQLKGAGPTPYSRTADGLAVLRSSLREFLCSEAMHHLGVPTTHALSLVASGEEVLRDMFYDGNPQPEPGAIVCRVAPSFLRFGSYELFAARQQPGLLRQLADYTIRQHFPLLAPNSRPLERENYVAWFSTVCERTAELLVHWMRVGFVHGVMNTDNMSILGLTIDYGPYGWLEPYDPLWTPNTTDAEGRRYRFGQQPQVALWNLVQLANALYPLIEETTPLEDSLDQYRHHYEQQWLQMMRSKLGLQRPDPRDSELCTALLDCLQLVETDMTLLFRALGDLDMEQGTEQLLAALSDCWYQSQPGEAVQRQWLDWLQRYQQRLREEDATTDRRGRMHAVNPLYVLRNYLAQQAIDAASAGDLGKLLELQQVLQQPYTEQTGKQHLAAKRPEWARHKAGCSMLSCSS
jgi:uncharacterized protein YdiU (UPF0061 family)